MLILKVPTFSSEGRRIGPCLEMLSRAPVILVHFPSAEEVRRFLRPVKRSAGNDATVTSAFLINPRRFNKESIAWLAKSMCGEVCELEVGGTMFAAVVCKRILGAIKARLASSMEFVSQ